MRVSALDSLEVPKDHHPEMDSGDVTESADVTESQNGEQPVPSRLRVLGSLALLLALLAVFLVPRYLDQGTLYFSVLHDPAGVYVYVPFQVAGMALWGEGVAPLWNPWSGCGTPHLANFQSSVFYPLNILFALLPPVPAAEVLLVLRLTLCAGATFVLGRSLKLSQSASIFLAAAFALNNWQLRFANVGNLNSDLLLPLTAAAFLRLGENPRLRTFFAAALLIAGHVFAGMPECAAFAFGFAALLYLFAAFVGEGRSSRLGAGRKLGLLGVVYVLGAWISAVQILPFLEYLQVSWSQHGPGSTLALHTQSPAAFQTLAYPFLEGSVDVEATCLTLGAVGALFFVRGCVRPLYGGLNYALAIFTLLGVYKLFGVFPVQSIGNLPLLEMLAYQRYLVTPLLLAAMIVAALGFEDWLARSRFGIEALERTFWLAVPVLFLFPLWLQGRGGNWRGALDSYAWPLIAQTFAAGALGAFSDRLRLGRSMLAVLVITLLCGELWLHASRLEPIGSPFKTHYAGHLEEPGRQVSAFLKERLVPASRMDMQAGLGANLGLVMGPVPSLEYYDAINVDRYRAYRAALTRRDRDDKDLGLEIPSSRMSSPLLDLAAVGSILTIPGTLEARRIRIGREGTSPAPGRKASQAQKPTYRLNAHGTDCLHAIVAPPSFEVDQRIRLAQADTLSFCYGVESEEAGAGPFTFRIGANRGATLEPLFEDSFAAGETGWREATVDISHLSALDEKGAAILRLEVEGEGKGSTQCGFGGLVVSKKETQHDHLKPIFADPPYEVLENTRALPRAFVAHQATVVEDPEQALALLSDPERSAPFTSGTSVLLEKPLDHPALPGSGGQAGGNGELPFSASTVAFAHSSPHHIMLAVEAAAPGVLVLCDTYYPGWKVKVDGKKQRILRANYLFRGVPIEQGPHRVEFRYKPLSVRFGALISFSSLFLVGGIAAMLRRRHAEAAVG